MRTLIYVCAALLPVASAFTIAYWAAPSGWSSNKKQVVASPRIVVPNSLEEAKKMASERLDHLQKLTQRQWDMERKTIPNKYPPARIEDAIARAQLRVNDLATLPPEMWKIERKKMIARAGAN